MLAGLIIVGVAGGLGAALANRGVVLFHDALRSIFPEVMQGHMRRREFASLALSSTLGLMIGYGIPFSVVSSVVLGHALWIGTDIIGAWFPGSIDRGKGSILRDRLGLAGSIVCGVVYGEVLIVGIRWLGSVAARLPADSLGPMRSLGDLVIFMLAVVPALSIAYQCGPRHGVIAFLITMLSRQVAMVLGQERPDAWAFLVGMLVLAAHLIRDARREPPTEAVLAVSVEHVRRVRSNLPYIAVLGAVYGLATHMGVIMEGPQSLLALARGDRMAAVGYTFVRALSYIPLRTMSILSTGVFTMEGLGFAPTAGLLSPSPFVAAALGAAVMTGETLSLVTVARVLGRYPCMLRAANSIRTAMTRLLDLASLIGGMVAANALIPGFGFFAVAGVYCLNEVAGAPIIRAAIGPICIVAVALLANLLRVLG